MKSWEIKSDKPQNGDKVIDNVFINNSVYERLLLSQPWVNLSCELLHYTKQINPIEIDVHGIKETEYQEVIKKLLVFKYTDEGSLKGMGRLYKTEEFLYMEIMKIFYRMLDLIICKEPKITCTAVSLPIQNFSMCNFTKLCLFG